MMEFTYEGVVRQGFGFYNPNHAAALICAWLPFCWAALLRWKQFTCRMVFGGLTLLLTVALAMTYSRSGVLIFFMELGLFYLSQKKRSWKVFLGILVGALLVFLAVGVWGRFSVDRAVLNRLDIWRAGASLFAANPWWGVGHGNSGTLATAFLLRDGIICRTLVNSHLTLLVEYGIWVGWIWCGAIAYALIAGWRRRAAWAAFAGMCVAAGLASVFDWGVLWDFQEWGGLPLTNFLLSWLLFLWFLGVGGWLCVGDFCWKRAVVAGGIAGIICAGVWCFPAGDAPRICDGMVIPAGAEEGRTLVLLPEGMPLKEAVEFLKRYGYVDWRIPLPGQPVQCWTAEEVVFFGVAAEYSGMYGEKQLTFVSPPGYFLLPARTWKLYLKRFRREFFLESQAEERNIPVIRY